MIPPGKWTRLAACLFATLPAGAQVVRGPVLGFVVDSGSGGIRSVSGTPAAASIGASLDLPPDIAAAQVSPRGDYLFTLAGPTREASLGLLPAAEMHRIPGVAAGATRIVLSPDGSSAAFYYPEANRVDVVTGLPAAPSAPREVYLTPLRNPLKDFAISDDGELLLCSEAANPDGGPAPSVVVLGRSGDLNRITPGGAATAIAFGRHSHDAVIVSSFDSFVVRDVGAPGERIALPGDAIRGATAAAFSAEGSRIYFVLARTRRVAVYDTASSATATLMCGCQPQGLYPMGSGAFRLTGYTGAAIPILDAGSGEPRIFQIPPVVNRDSPQ